MESGNEPSLRAAAVLGAGRAALIESFGGAFWLSWGLSHAKAFAGFGGPVFGSIALLILISAVLTIRKGRLLRKGYPPIPSSSRRTMWRSFALILGLEILGIFLAFVVASRLHRPDLFADWFALVVGLHFLPLVKTFRAPVLGFFGTLIVLWSLLCWTLFRGDALLIWVAAGTGVLLWMMSISAQFLAWRIARSLATREGAGGAGQSFA